MTVTAATAATAATAVAASEVAATTTAAVTVDAPAVAQVAAVVPAVAARTGAAPKAVAAPTAAPAQAVSTVQDRVNTGVTGFFDLVSDFLAGLPDNVFTVTLEGALLELRRKLFNQAPTATPIQHTTSLVDGTIRGSIGGIDPDGDAIAYRVTTDPQFGTVEVAADGSYVYTPGQDYSGSDSFSVQISCAPGGFNILNPGGHGSTDVMVLVGAQAATNPFTGTGAHQDPIDAALHLDEAAARITVTGGRGRETATVALMDITPDTQLTWMDITGRMGTVSVAEMATTHWDEYASAAETNGGGVTLGVTYTAADGSAQAVILTDVHATQTPDGQYVFTGVLAPDAEEKPGYEDDFWDVIGSEYKAQYETFRRQNVEVPNFTSVAFNVTGADVYADTYTLGEYKALVKAHPDDPGVRLDLGRTNPGNAATTTPTYVELPTTTEWGIGQKATALLADGNGSAPGGATVGFEDGSVRQWNGTSWTTLRERQQITYESSTAVSNIVTAADGLIVLAGGYAELVGSDGKSIRRFAIGDEGQSIVRDSAGRYVIGGYWNHTVNSGSTTVELWDGKVYDGTNGGVVEIGKFDDAKLLAMIPYQNGVVVALDDGTVQQWDGTSTGQSGWTQLLDDNSFLYGNYVVTGMALSADGGIVISQSPDDGREIYRLKKYNGTDWQEYKVYEPGMVNRGEVTALTPVAPSATGDLIVGYGNGDVLKVDVANNQQYAYGSYPYSWTAATRLSWDSARVVIPFGDGLLVGLNDGSVQRWTPAAGWTSLGDMPGDFAAMVAAGDGFLITTNDGGNGFAAQWNPATGWIQLGGNYQPFSEDQLKNAVAFAQKSYVNPNAPITERLFADQILTASDPLFGLEQNQPACTSCQGKFYKVAYATNPETLIMPAALTYKTGFTAPTQSWVEAGIGFGLSTYGYAFVPDGTWNKMDPNKFSFAGFIALQAGPTVNMVLGDQTDQLTLAEVPLTESELLRVMLGPAPLTVTAGATLGLQAKLDLPADFQDQDWYLKQLSAGAYIVPGLYMSYNTKGTSGFSIGFNATAFVDYDDVAKVSGVSVSPTLAPYLNASWGWKIPDEVSLVGGGSILEIGAGLQFPLSVNLELDSGNPSISLSAKSDLLLNASALGFISSLTTYKYVIPIFNKDTGNLLPSPY